MRLRPLAFLAVAATLAAGCLDAGPSSHAAAAPRLSYPATLAASLPAAPAWDGEAGIAWWEEFATTYTLRNSFLPNNQAATDHLAGALRGLGLDVRVLTYPACTPVVRVGCAPAPAGPIEFHVVMGLKKGTAQPDHAIALGAHYDNVYPGASRTEGTLQAAYDNGSGTAMVYNVCKQLAQAAMDKSLLCLFFDGEEEGIEGSTSFVASPPAGAPAIDAYLGYDMVGLNWPGYATWKLYNWVDAEHAPDLQPFVNETVHGLLAWPGDGAEVFPFNDRNSDELAFIDAHIATVRFAGGRKAGDYPQYHKQGDTVDFVEQMAGGRDNYRAGFGAIVQESVLLARLLDRTGLAELHKQYAT
jgi:hypothetical protein